MAACSRVYWLLAGAIWQGYPDCHLLQCHLRPLFEGIRTGSLDQVEALVLESPAWDLCRLLSLSGPVYSMLKCVMVTFLQQGLVEIMGLASERGRDLW